MPPEIEARVAACNICSASSPPFARGRVLEKYDVQYFRCDSCGFVQTESPYWLAEAYSEAIARSDVGVVQRNLEMAAVTSAVIRAFFDPRATFLDCGAGYGLLVRLLRDAGLDFRWSDKYAENLFARGFEDDGRAEPYELATAFEVFEHLVDPLAEIGDMLSRGNALLFSTLLVPSPTPAPEAWWYYAPATGQHVSLYTRRSLEEVARHFGVRLYSDGAFVHLLTRRPLSAALFRLVTRRRVARALGPLVRGRSLIADDFSRLTGRRLP